MRPMKTTSVPRISWLSLSLMTLWPRGVIASVSVVVAISFILLVHRADSQDTVVSERLAARMAELRKSLDDPVSPGVVRDDRRLTVTALIELFKERVRPDQHPAQAGAVLRALAEFGDDERAVRFLVENLAFVESWVRQANKLKRFPAAHSLARIGLPSRDMLLAVAEPLSEINLQLRAYLLAQFDQNHDDVDSGRLMAVNRLMRRVEQLDRQVVLPEHEEAKRHAIKNTRYMISLLSDPALFAQPIPRPDEN